mmetsp:Transcript_26818/g.80794  ORF Transcript_26818/g.80794 Transcript_26818/m.80794 type:complete len:245 (+) Transcript_26818:490-1224(+)
MAWLTKSSSLKPPSGDEAKCLAAAELRIRCTSSSRPMRPLTSSANHLATPLFKFTRSLRNLLWPLPACGASRRNSTDGSAGECWQCATLSTSSSCCCCCCCSLSSSSSSSQRSGTWRKEDRWLDTAASSRVVGAGSVTSASATSAAAASAFSCCGAARAKASQGSGSGGATGAWASGACSAEKASLLGRSVLRLWLASHGGNAAWELPCSFLGAFGALGEGARGASLRAWLSDCRTCCFKVFKQ